MQQEVVRHCSEPFLAGNFKAKCMSVIGEKNISRQKKEATLQDIMASLNTDEETTKDLMEICDPANLRCPLEEKLDIKDNASLQSITAKDCPLQSVRLCKNAQKRSVVVNYMFHIWETTKKDPSKELPSDLEDGSVILSVMLYHPVKQSKEQGYLVLAGQNLTVLKDAIQCISDHAIYGESSHNPDAPSSSKGNKSKSGFFFIEGVFYNDMRDSYNRDYSTEIIDWAKSNYKWSSNRLGSFKSKRMEDTKFEQLKIRLGYPYYYCHQGNCEHLVIFDDMRLLHQDDPQNSTMYPYRTFKKIPKRSKCSVCDLYTAKWITTNDVLAFEDPSFFCAKCFDLLHYDENKKKLHEFEAYHFDGGYNP